MKEELQARSKEHVTRRKRNKLGGTSILMLARSISPALAKQERVTSAE